VDVLQAQSLTTDAQGWLFGRAVPADAIEAMLRASSSAVSETGAGDNLDQPASDTKARRRTA